MSQTAAPTATPAAGKKPKLPREEDPRNPNFRLAAFFDEDTCAVSGAPCPF